MHPDLRDLHKSVRAYPTRRSSDRPPRAGRSRHHWAFVIARMPRPCGERSEEHTSELQSHGLISYAVFCWKKKKDPEYRPARRGAGARRRDGDHRADDDGHLRRPFFFHHPATTEIHTRPYTLSLHDALPISNGSGKSGCFSHAIIESAFIARIYSSPPRSEEHTSELQSHGLISYAVFCLKKKKKQTSFLTSINPLIQINTLSYL